MEQYVLRSLDTDVWLELHLWVCSRGLLPAIRRIIRLKRMVGALREWWEQEARTPTHCRAAGARNCHTQWCRELEGGKKKLRMMVGFFLLDNDGWWWFEMVGGALRWWWWWCLACIRSASSCSDLLCSDQQEISQRQTLCLLMLLIRSW